MWWRSRVGGLTGPGWAGVSKTEAYFDRITHCRNPSLVANRYPGPFFQDAAISFPLGGALVCESALGARVQSPPMTKRISTPRRLIVIGKTRVTISSWTFAKGRVT